MTDIATAADPTNPLLGKWTGAFGLPPFAAIAAEHFRPAFDAALARHRAEIDAMVPVDSERAIAEMRRLAREFGMFVGPSSGAHLVAARELRDADPGVENVVTFFCDEGEKYIADYFVA